MVGDGRLELPTPCMSSKGGEVDNDLRSNDLQQSNGLASNSPSTLSPENAPNTAPEAAPPAPDTTAIIEAVKGMSDVERGKLLAALLGKMLEEKGQ